MRVIQICVLMAVALFVGIGCASSGGGNGNVDMAAAMPHQSSTPEWISQPRLEGGMVVTECVEDTAPMSILKTKSSALARSRLATELEQKTSALTCNAQAQTDTAEGSEFLSSMEARMQGISRQYLRGTRIARADYAQVGGRQQYCSMVVIQPQQAEKLRDALFDGAGMEFSDSEEAQLWEDFLYAEVTDTLGNCAPE